MLKKIILSILFIVPIFIFGNDVDKVKRAVSKAAGPDDNFRYNYKAESEGFVDNIYEVIYDPLKEQKHTLLKINGEVPTEKDLKKFNKSVLEDEERKAGDDFSELLTGDYKYISTEGDISSYSYVTQMRLNPKEKSKLNARIWINNKTEEVVKITLKNQRDIKIQMGVALNYFHMELNFKKFNDTISVLDNTFMDLKGKALVVDFNQKTINKMYNYELAN